MEWIREIFLEILMAGLGIVLTAVSGKLGGILGKYWKEKASDERIRSVARICVGAVEMMYRESDGGKKLKEAIVLAGEMLEEKGIAMSEERIRIFLESALAEWKGAFERA